MDVEFYFQHSGNVELSVFDTKTDGGSDVKTDCKTSLPGNWIKDF